MLQAIASQKVCRLSRTRPRTSSRSDIKDFTTHAVVLVLDSEIFQRCTGKVHWSIVWGTNKIPCDFWRFWRRRSTLHLPRQRGRDYPDLLPFELNLRSFHHNSKPTISSLVIITILVPTHNLIAYVLPIIQSRCSPCKQSPLFTRLPRSTARHERLVIVSSAARVKDPDHG